MRLKEQTDITGHSLFNCQQGPEVSPLSTTPALSDAFMDVMPAEQGGKPPFSRIKRQTAVCTRQLEASLITEKNLACLYLQAQFSSRFQDSYFQFGL